MYPLSAISGASQVQIHKMTHRSAILRYLGPQTGLGSSTSRQVQVKLQVLYITTSTSTSTSTSLKAQVQVLCKNASTSTITSTFVMSVCALRCIHAKTGKRHSEGADLHNNKGLLRLKIDLQSYNGIDVSQTYSFMDLL